MRPTDTKYDHDLLRRVAAGDEQAFRQLFDTFHDRLFLFIREFIHSGQVAEELVLDVFMKIWLGRDLLPQVQDFRAFLYRIARNKALDFFRAAARNSRLREHLAKELRLANEAGADSALMVKEYEALVREAISLLSPQRKQAYLLSREQHLSHDEIASRMQISRATVNSHIVEAQRFIREHLARHLDIALALVLFAGK